MNTAGYVALGQKVIHNFQHWREPNPHLELSDEEYFLLYCTEPKLTPDEIEQQTITEEEHGK